MAFLCNYSSERELGVMDQHWYTICPTWRRQSLFTVKWQKRASGPDNDVGPITLMNQSKRLETKWKVKIQWHRGITHNVDKLRQRSVCRQLSVVAQRRLYFVGGDEPDNFGARRQRTDQLSCDRRRWRCQFPFVFYDVNILLKCPYSVI